MERIFQLSEEGNCTISNSLAQNCICSFVIDRKSWLFFRSSQRVQASAGIYILLENANGISPMKYIKYILFAVHGSAFLEFSEILMTICRRTHM